jgi:hypothetical protein
MPYKTFAKTMLKVQPPLIQSWLLKVCVCWYFKWIHMSSPLCSLFVYSNCSFLIVKLLIFKDVVQYKLTHVSLWCLPFWYSLCHAHTIKSKGPYWENEALTTHLPFTQVSSWVVGWAHFQPQIMVSLFTHNHQYSSRVDCPWVTVTPTSAICGVKT